MMRLFKRSKKVTPAQERPPPKNAFDDPSSIGNILVNLGRISRDELHAAIGQQAQFNDALLGALLCQRGVTTGDDIAKALQIQEKMRAGDTVAAELDVLETKLSECAASGRELSRVIASKKQIRRDNGESSGLFLVTATSVTRKA